MTVSWRSRAAAAFLTAATAALLAGCGDQFDTAGSGRSLTPVSAKTLALMESIGTTDSSPVLIRTYKKEAELQIWKMKSDGQYAFLKSYPMCRWSGQLGPKTHEGDRQVPEGFYTITPGQMNPNSNYYLSFNVGYPNAYDRAYGRDGGTIMVHGACSSAGCFSMTDAQIGEIYAIARDAFNGGQRAIQMQSYPFKMTAENLAKHRLDPNIAFWKELKNGADHFEVTKAEPSVLVCGKHYVFGAHAEGDLSASAACPKLTRDADVEAAVAQKAGQDDTAVAALVAKGVKPVRLVYEDGGQNEVFSGKFDTSRPDALASAPREIQLDETGKPLPAVVAVAAADASSNQRAVTPRASAPAGLGPASAAPGQSPAPAAGLLDGGKSLMTGLFSKVTGDTTPAIKVFEPAEPIPAVAPLPPRRSAAAEAPVRMASVVKAKPDALDAAQAPLPH